MKTMKKKESHGNTRSEYIVREMKNVFNRLINSHGKNIQRDKLEWEDQNRGSKKCAKIPNDLSCVIGFPGGEKWHRTEEIFVFEETMVKNLPKLMIST